MSFMLCVSLAGLVPFTTIYTLGVGLFIVAVHGFYVFFHPQTDTIHALFYSLFVGGSYIVACTAAWVRERSLRAEFTAKRRSVDRAM